MLICYRSIGNTSVSVGIALSQWKIKGESRIYVLLPQDSLKYCEVEIVYSPQFEWCLLESDTAEIVFDSGELKKDKVLPLNKEIDQDIYFVWDDGALNHPDKAAKLYDYFKDLIEQYRSTALIIKNALFEKEYQAKIKEAKDNGWDTELVLRKVPVQAYDNN